MTNITALPLPAAQEPPGPSSPRLYTEAEVTQMVAAAAMAAVVTVMARYGLSASPAPACHLSVMPS
jgi:hypothetical protein